ncbi:mechanosensitive ion channel family protein [Aegicerativicinus sediminis]
MAVELRDRIDKSLETLLTKLNAWWDSFVENIPNLVIAVLVLIAAYILAGYISRLVEKLVRRRVHKKSVSNMVSKISAVVVVMVGLFLALGILNLSQALTSLLAGAGVLGLVIGLALQETLSNTVAGVVLSFRDKIRLGDWVETSGFAGEVLDINLKNFILKEADNKIVIIPNKVIIGNSLKNFTLNGDMRLSVSCGVGYESDLEMVKSITISTIKEEFKEESKEEVEFFYTEFGESSINFICRFWFKGKNAKEALGAKSRAIMAIRKAFRENEINIPFPIRTIDFSNELTTYTVSPNSTE